MSQTTQGAEREYQSFKEFYPFYLSQHEDPVCRRLHFVGSWVVIALLLFAAVTANPWILLGVPVAGYGFAWIGHFGFEKNKPATFTYPGYSLMGDWVMFWEILTGKISINGS